MPSSLLNSPRQRHLAPRALTLALRTAFLGLPLLAAIPAQAQTAPAAREFNIGAGPLSRALTQFAAEAGVLLSVDASLTEGRSTAGLQGRYTVDQGLSRLVAGTGLEVAPGAGSGYSLRRAPPTSAATSAATLTAVNVSASVDNEIAVGPVLGYVAKRSATATKTDTPILETPQSISIVTREQMQDYGIHGIEEAVWHSAGVVGGAYGFDSRSDWLLVRGFDPSRYMDGLPLPNGTWTGATRIEPYGLERIEVLKGPSSGLYGAMPPGGLINVVSKRPTEERLREIELQAGSFQQRQVAADFSGPLDDEGRLLYRVTGLVRKSDTQIDHVKDDRYFLAPSLTWKLSSDTAVTFLARYQKGETALGGGFLPSQGTARFNPNGKISPSVFTGEPGYDNYDKEFKSVGYEVQHRINENLTFRQNLRQANVDLDHNSIGTLGLQDDLRTLNRYYYPLEEHSRAFTVDNQLETRFATGDFKHTLLVGLDYSRLSNDYASGYAGGAPTIDIFNPVYGAALATPAYNYHVDQTQKQLGLYAQDQIRIGRWIGTLGLRRDWSDTDTDNRIADTQTTTKENAWSGRVGVNYVFESGIAPYAAYSRSFQPVIGATARGEPFKATKGDQYEAGVKYQPTGRSDQYTVAVYNMTQKNTQTLDPNVAFATVQQGKTQVRGAELEARVNVARGFKVIGSYAYNDAKAKESNDSLEEGKQLRLVPRHQASIGADYTFQSGPLARFGFGGALRYMGKHYGDTYNQWGTSGYTIVDAQAHYDIDQWRLQLNISNLFDKEYVAVCQSATWCYYGAPRTVTLTARYQF
jgi:iron complex outermembrane receptor protein